MKIIIGFGNNLRGEDAFGVDVITKLQKQKLQNTKFISTHQLTPELSLQLKDASSLVFIDAAFNHFDTYNLACSLEEDKQNTLSHHISIKTIIMMLEKLFNKSIKYEVYSMLTHNFEKIVDENKYNESIEKLVKFIKNS